jgi:hypothetical protein
MRPGIRSILFHLLLCISATLTSAYLASSSYAIHINIKNNIKSNKGRRQEVTTTSSLQHRLSSLSLPLLSTTTALHEKYRRGAEIYPLTNRISFTLADSFPNGIVPQMAQIILADKGPLTPQQLQDLAKVQLQQDIDDDDSANANSNADDQRMDPSSNAKANTTAARRNKRFEPKLPPIIALVLVAKGLVSPGHMLFTIFFSGYISILNIIASSPRNDIDSHDPSSADPSESSYSSASASLQPILPSLPPQGHVPDLISNPLGIAITESYVYQNWLRTGELFGYFLPLLALATGFADQCVTNIPARLVPSYVTMTHMATSMFLICCQVMTEAATKRCGAPLPLRIFVPVAYNAVRMGPLYNWMLAGWDVMRLWEKMLALGNFVYWGTNLFGFLLPVASLRYMRSHFFCVEAQEVVLRRGAF